MKECLVESYIADISVFIDSDWSCQIELVFLITGFHANVLMCGLRNDVMTLDIPHSSTRMLHMHTHFFKIIFRDYTSSICSILFVCRPVCSS